MPKAVRCLILTTNETLADAAPSLLTFMCFLTNWKTPAFSTTSAGVSAASMTELSFNWTGFTGAMIANFMFTYRNLLGKKAMVSGVATPRMDQLCGLNCLTPLADRLPRLVAGNRLQLCNLHRLPAELMNAGAEDSERRL